jgi:multiple sugar transport system ATP-binding protein
MFVAGFIGSPQMNFFDVSLDNEDVVLSDGNRFKLTSETAEKLKKYGKNKLILGIRGEDIKFDSNNIALYRDSVLKSVIENNEIMGNENNLYFPIGGITAVARVSKYEVSQIGDKVEFVFMPHKAHFFDADTKETI